jgi:hypothetical protein
MIRGALKNAYRKPFCSDRWMLRRLKAFPITNFLIISRLRLLLVIKAKVRVRVRVNKPVGIGENVGDLKDMLPVSLRQKTVGWFTPLLSFLPSDVEGPKSP